MKALKMRSAIGRLTGGRGATNALRKAYGVYRREGMAGVRRKLTWLRAGAPGVIDAGEYARWIERYDRIEEAVLESIRARINAFSSAPLISVVMPVYNPKPEWLAQAIESVRHQIYPHWELCIADDRSPDPAIRELLERYAVDEPRIKVVFREENGHISAASNSALSLATGAWVALLDHDDLLPAHALFCVADAIVRNPSVQLVYSDEDKIDASGNRFEPYFKCDWNPDLFRSHNMFSHLGVYRKALVDEVGGFRLGFEGSQDYDLAFRCVERVEAAQILHIPRVLYHWRLHAASTASGVEAKPYAAIVGENAINEHLQRQAVQGAAEYIDYGYRVRYALPAQPPLVSIIVPTRNALHLLRQCIDSVLEKTRYPKYEILVVDNGSDDAETLRFLTSIAENPQIRVLRDARPFNYSALNNRAVEAANGELLCLLNNDIEVISPEWLSEMVSLALQPRVGAVGAKLLFPDDTIQHAGLVLGIQGVAGNAHKHVPRATRGYFGRAALVNSFSAVTAACLVTRKAVYEEVGGLDEVNLAVAYNDVDFCLRVREAGYRNVWTPFAELYHHESATRGLDDDPVKRERFECETAWMKHRWREALKHDPFYSPNLTIERDDFSLAWPPRVPSIA
ncbi:glycosyltransferase family 2 protein [Paraburkholderia ferrariae]|uniref:Glycosyltransferase family 2 protein n=1 Tax=Paraburkholderia ferrariae TaxID=386056 RepID=A0ABU9RTF5_9BURK